ncbi:hypothetical protein PMO31116_01943 [Pandoraea morbifera]|uniref:Uncharacterized protein n=1 Tax=Pandoraea morbifera TaxID=2508300 RepID=A0A5E4UDG1_9BURK|nr:hypothetical protein PMO31116_01943 [Pandoraea morbifera]
MGVTTPGDGVALVSYDTRTIPRRSQVRRPGPLPAGNTLALRDAVHCQYACLACLVPQADQGNAGIAASTPSMCASG